MKVHPAIAARVTQASAVRGFSKSGSTYRRETGARQGLILAYDERELGSGVTPFRASRWYLAVCPAPYSEFLNRVRREDRPFEHFRVQDDAAVILEPPWRDGTPYQGEPGYDPTDPADIAAFSDHLIGWFEEVLPRVVDWLEDPGRLLDAMNADSARPYPERHLQPVMIVCGLEVIQAAAGRFDEARAGLAQWEHLANQDPDRAPHLALAAIVRDMYPELGSLAQQEI